MPDTSRLYRTRATTSGGPPGTVRSDDGRLVLKLATPTELGGTAGAQGTNPEQLLAAAYAACFHTALAQAAAEARQPLPAELAVDCDVGLRRRDGGFALDVDIAVRADRTEPARLQPLLDRAVALWPHAPGVMPQVHLQHAQPA